MFNNVGRKIKGVAQAFTTIGIIISVLIFIILIIPAGEAVEEGNGAALILPFVVLTVGCIISWLSSLVLYGFGQLVENSDVIAGKQNNTPLSEDNDNLYRNDRYYRASVADERTFEQIVVNSNLSDLQKQQIINMKKMLDDDLIDVTIFCNSLRQVASNQSVEFINKLISKL